MVDPIRYAHLLIVTLLCAASCNVDDEAKDQIVQVDPEFTIDLFEKLSENNHTLSFIISSIDTQDCTNYEIDASSAHSSNFIRLVINDIVIPENCNPGQAFATTELDAAPLSIGTYDFEVVLKDAIFSEGILDVSPQSYRVYMDTTNGFYFLHKELKRIPNQLVWGFVGYDNQDEDKPYADQFVADLRTLCSNVNLQNGYYGYFTVDGADLSLIPAPTFTYFQEFAYLLDENITALKDLLFQYRNSTAAHHISIVVNTWQGESL